MKATIWPFPASSPKLLHECSECDNPYPYKCEHCLYETRATTEQDEELVVVGTNVLPCGRLYVGSGEDALMHLD